MTKKKPTPITLDELRDLIVTLGLTLKSDSKTETRRQVLMLALRRIDSSFRGLTQGLFRKGLLTLDGIPVQLSRRRSGKRR